MKLILLSLVLVFNAFASQNYVNMKNCETITLSKFTTLISCHNMDYLVQYRIVDDEEKDTIKKITAITQKDKKIIINLGK